MENRVKLIIFILVVQVITNTTTKIYSIEIPNFLFTLILIITGICDVCFDTKFSKWCDSKKLFKL